MRILSGIQSSGKLHIGNYFGAIRQFVAMQDQGEALFFIADMHSLTTVRDGKRLKELSLDVALDFLALGLDPARAVLFRQSDIPEVTELFWYLSTIMPMGRLERAVSYKDKVDHGISADVGLFTYPVLMAADILVYGSDVVPVGKDQIQHLEITRDIAITFNQLFVPHFDAANPDGDKKGRGKAVLRLPRPLVQEATAVVPGTDGQKMSKSYGNVIELFADDKTVKKQIMGIKTDSTPVDDPKDPDATPLLPLIKLFGSAADVAETERTFRAGKVGYGTYKQQILDLFHATFGAARARRLELAADLPEVEKILQAGAEKARGHAAPVMDEVRRLVGTFPRPLPSALSLLEREQRQLANKLDDLRRNSLLSPVASMHDQSGQKATRIELLQSIVAQADQIKVRAAQADQIKVAAEAEIASLRRPTDPESQSTKES